MFTCWRDQQNLFCFPVLKHKKRGNPQRNHPKVHISYTEWKLLHSHINIQSIIFVNMKCIKKYSPQTIFILLRVSIFPRIQNTSIGLFMFVYNVSWISHWLLQQQQLPFSFYSHTKFLFCRFNSSFKSVFISVFRSLLIKSAVLIFSSRNLTSSRYAFFYSIFNSQVNVSHS